MKEVKTNTFTRKTLLYIIVLLCLAPFSWAAVPLGDIDKDGQLTEQDRDSLSELLRHEDYDITVVDLDLNNEFDENDLRLIEHFLLLQRTSPHSPLLSFFRRLLGQETMKKNDMKEFIEELTLVPSKERSISLKILKDYLSFGGGKRNPRTHQAGGAISFNPKEAVFLVTAALLNQEVCALVAGRTKERGSLAFNDTVRQLSKSLDELKVLATEGDLDNLQSQKWLDAVLAETRERLKNAAMATDLDEKPAFAPSKVIKVPPKILDGPGVIVQQVDKKVASQDTSKWKWIFGTICLGIGAFFIFYSKQSEPKIVPASLPIDREATTVLSPNRMKTKSQVAETKPVAISGLSHRMAKKLPERYCVVGELGKGGQAVVFLADDVTLNRRVAIKVIDESAFSGLAVKRFLREAETLASMSHQGIPKIYDLQEKPPFIVMEYIAGQNLWSIIRKGCPDFLQGLQWTFELFSLLAHCHEQSIFHRDIKPGNIIISEKGLHLIDFGLVKREDDTQITSDGKMLGTWSYFAPEQFRAGTSTPRTELYSAGLVAYELMTGLYPFASSHPFPPQVMQEPRSPRSLAADLHPAFEEFLMSLLKKSPSERPQSVAEAYSQLEVLTRKHLRCLPPILSSNQSMRIES